MRDPRIKKLAQTLVHYSCKVKPGEKVWIIDLSDTDTAMGEALVEEVFLAGGLPMIRLHDTRVQRRLLMGYTEEQLDFLGKEDASLMAQCACYIGVSGLNAFRAPMCRKARSACTTACTQTRFTGRSAPKTRWVVLRYPTPGMAEWLR